MNFSRPDIQITLKQTYLQTRFWLDFEHPPTHNVYTDFKMVTSVLIKLEVSLVTESLRYKLRVQEVHMPASQAYAASSRPKLQ